ncbi:MAG: hypothetical protein ACOC9Z_08845 [Chloroflexota bacterium]
MKRFYFPILFFVLIAGAFSIDSALVTVQGVHAVDPASPPVSNGVDQSEDVDGQVPIQLTERISIPFGIAPVLPLHDVGETVIVSGHGGCTADETVTVVISVTQATGANAMGQTDLSCSGQMQQWQVISTLETGAGLALGNAEACGVATTRSDGKVTDTFEWCRDVVLGRPTYLPLILETSDFS